MPAGKRNPWIQISIGIFLATGIVMAAVWYDKQGFTILMSTTLGLVVYTWLFRTVADGKQDSFILNVTVFTFVQQVNLTANILVSAGPVAEWVWLSLFALMLVGLLEVALFAWQRHITKNHVQSVLRANLKHGQSTAPVDVWASAAVSMIGVDFFPEFFGNNLMPVGRDDKRAEFLSLLSRDTFNDISADDLIVPEAKRRNLWRLFVVLPIIAFAILLSNIPYYTVS